MTSVLICASCMRTTCNGLLDMVIYTWYPARFMLNKKLHALLQGAAWLQSQATSAAAFSASADLPMTSAAATSASMKASPVSASLGKHRRHASTSPFALPDQEFFSRPRDGGMPEAAPEGAATPMQSQANQLNAGHHAARVAAAGTSATCAHMTGQESLQKATVALKGLQTKFGQASSTAQSSSGSSFGMSQEMPLSTGSTADTEADRSPFKSSAAPSSSRSSFSFQTAVGLRPAARLSGDAHHSSSGGAHPSISRGVHPSSSGGTHPSSSGGFRPHSSGGPHFSSSADESPHAGSSAAEYLMVCLQTGTPASTVSFTAMTCSSRLQPCCCRI